MDKLEAYPPPCEIGASTQAAVDHCDKLDGLVDGIISRPSYCDFDPYSLVGKNFRGKAVHSVFSETGADIVQAAWNGPHANGFSWPGVSFDANLTASAVVTRCDGNASTCSSSLQESLFGTAIKNLILGNPDFDLKTMTVEDFHRTLALAGAKYRQWVGAANPDLRPF